jgi:uncharacterized sporulation protein YeaH/YhbH (DUF444 family)
VVCLVDVSAMLGNYRRALGDKLFVFLYLYMRICFVSNCSVIILPKSPS